ncbi:hypothetical protein LOTGIDRAFT_163872 [Lottia gigantea]|uniref:Chitin-binding type-2 domain-containing protein n=1 Tax=Lottia gigantea TaxID=225164 RepID=V4ABG5_LOTGI|nr:hypothetical protein LOTGIDRAFT_163872 [Lottia gigantea]ESO90651.1 hypothetical protein LOTGIDRAFT_163872 [Lottia gigantea]
MCTSFNALNGVLLDNTFDAPGAPEFKFISVTGLAINPCVSNCTGSADGRFPDCDSCATYHVCSNQQITRQNCAVGSQYDLISETCQPQAQAVCGNNFYSLPTQCTVDCSNVGSGEFPYCGDCSKYIVCNAGSVVQPIQCPNNEVYNLLVRSCTPPSGSVCGYYPSLSSLSSLTNNLDLAPSNQLPQLSLTIEGTACTSDCKEVSQNGAYPYCASCSAFVLCYNNAIFQRISCPNNLRFDAVNLRCDLQDVAICGTPPEMTTGVPSSERVTPAAFIIKECMVQSCSELTGIGQYPLCGACDKSVLCFGGVPIIKMCNRGLLFDAVNKRCTFPESASCAIAPVVVGTSPATSPRTSPATSPETSPATSPTTSPTTPPGITPRQTVVTTCSTDCSNISGVRYVPVCGDCSRGLFCAFGRIRTIIPCSSGFLYDFITRTCQRPAFTTCGVGELVEEPTTTAATADPNPDCISTCNGRRNGSYQSCAGCTFYVNCFNGSFNGVACPVVFGRFQTFWDDNLKTCVFRSSTCSSIGK